MITLEPFTIRIVDCKIRAALLLLVAKSRLLAMKSQKPVEPEKIICDECGVEWEDTEEGADALWSHCCVAPWRD